MNKTTENPLELPASGQRGTVDHERRHQIITAAEEHFRLYGYRKTSVADLGKAIGVSSTYIYRFFSSKQAIGEAVCSMVLTELDDELRAIVDRSGSPTHRFRSFARTAFERSLEIFLDGTRMHELVVVAMEEDWCPASGHEGALTEMIRLLVEAGRITGEFERKTPIDEVVSGITVALRPFVYPPSLQYRSREWLEARLPAVCSLILRSLAP
ncbi:TetR/AcrR family transcriptional regulator [Paraburkholderia dipogonis]|uniref:TetR/AcrR family transcriptional regulator n=1 Tax=Paraburkholderia dipogonis TaxID=1211383 RepID=A0A4Y8MX77_9BURK|nr:TetR/AcrR family transcriptional regulator [Paraburkholderia dipogonis]TFE41923.1 TetR/AcrR family transcriptional regulator [Paraburkholderia dipogonis]